MSAVVPGAIRPRPATAGRPRAPGGHRRNLDQGNRIEEHGIHILWGFHDRTLSMLRGAYTELQDAGDLRVSRFEEALRPYNVIHFTERVEGAWYKARVHFLPNQGKPGVTRRPGGLAGLRSARHPPGSSARCSPAP